MFFTTLENVFDSLTTDPDGSNFLLCKNSNIVPRENAVYAEQNHTNRACSTDDRRTCYTDCFVLMLVEVQVIIRKPATVSRVNKVKEPF